MREARPSLMSRLRGRLAGNLRRAVVDQSRAVRDHSNDLEQQRHRLAEIDDAIVVLREDIATVRQYMPIVLNTISSQNAAMRQIRRSEAALSAASERVETVDALSARLAEAERSAGAAEAAVATAQAQAEEAAQFVGDHASRLAYLESRLEFIRRETLYEVRFGARSPSAQAEGLEPSAPPQIDGDIRLNVGCGHVTVPGYLNVDVRALPGVDLVADVCSLPFEAESVAEIRCAHLLEHFPREELRRKVLPHWFALLRPGGRVVAVVPDAEAMLAGYAAGQMTFEELRRVTFGDQEYDGDYHFTMFTAGDLAELFVEAGFLRPATVASGRRNGDCLEFEMTACKGDGAAS